MDVGSDKPAGRPAGLLFALGGALAAVGSILLLVAPPSQGTYGWFAYQPLAGTVFLPPAGGTWTAGAVCLVAGVVVLAFAGGFVAGRRSAGRR